MNIIDRHRKPPTQIMRGSGFVLDLGRVHGVFDRYRMQRRVQKVTSAGVVRSRVAIVTYETTAAGHVRRIEEDGRSIEIQPGQDLGEWEWVEAALRYRHEARYLPRVMREAARPADLVRLQDEHTGEWIDAEHWEVT